MCVEFTLNFRVLLVCTASIHLPVVVTTTVFQQLLGKLKRQADEVSAKTCAERVLSVGRDVSRVVVVVFDQADVHRTKAAVTEEMSRLEAIVSKYKMTKADLDGTCWGCWLFAHLP